MLEASEEKDSEPLNIQRYLDLARRRHLQFLIPLFLGWLVVWGASWVLPARYKSGTLILVEQPTVPKNYVVPNISDNMQDGLQSITQQILSRTRLLLIIDKFNLYSDGRRHLTPDEKVERMRKDIDIELVRNTQDDAITAFNIFYSARDPRIAQQVTTELSKLFIQGNLEVRQRESQETTNFLESQLKDASTSLAAQEAKIREFKGEHEGELPTQQASNLQILSGLQSQLQNEQDALNTARQQRVYLQTLIDQYRTLHESFSPVDGAPTGLSAIDQDLGRLRSKLADLRSRYTDLYPDIQSLKQEIARTEKMRDALVASLKSKGKGSSQVERGEVIQGLAGPSQNSPILQLESQLQSNKIEIANREQAIAALKSRVNDYQARLNAEPVREQQLDDLTRGYDQSKANYDDLLKKESESKMATSMEQTQQGQRFSILDPPSLPLKPDFPSRLKFCGIGFAFGLAFGAVVVGGLEFLDDRLHGEEEIRTLLPMAVISEIPEISSTWDERRGKLRMAFGWVMAVMVVATILAGSAFSYLHN
jgi:polysaccharide chain length determinant protein (PEP-CTERM system associated)